MTDAETIRPSRLLAVALRQARLLVALPLIAATLAVGASFLVRPRFQSVTSAIPEATGGRAPQLSGAAIGIAAQLGVSLGGGGGSQSPLLYVQLLQSRRILGELLESRVPNPDPARFGTADSLTLLTVLDVAPRATPERRFEAGLVALRKDVLSMDVDIKTLLLTITAETEYPAVSALVAERALDRLVAFNREARRSQARARREFAEGRAREFERQLREAEEALTRFYTVNRSYRDAPALLNEAQRLQRAVQLRQELYVGVQREAENARLDEANDVPQLSVVDRAAVPVRKSFPNRALLAVVALLLGLGVAAARVLFDPAVAGPVPGGLTEEEYLAESWRRLRAGRAAGAAA
ncbi:MAG: GNVR domain-containing protein [Gemmatimonadales bacterium]|nr:GNVR domain-containing protein [Gemmatimonadales bacterium]